MVELPPISVDLDGVVVRPPFGLNVTISRSIALVSQPRCPSATAAAATDELTGLLGEAGFENFRTETLDLDPPVVCVIAHVAKLGP